MGVDGLLAGVEVEDLAAVAGEGALERVKRVALLTGVVVVKAGLLGVFLIAGVLRALLAGVVLEGVLLEGAALDGVALVGVGLAGVDGADALSSSFVCSSLSSMPKPLFSSTGCVVVVSLFAWSTAALASSCWMFDVSTSPTLTGESSAATSGATRPCIACSIGLSVGRRGDLPSTGLV